MCVWYDGGVIRSEKANPFLDSIWISAYCDTVFPFWRADWERILDDAQDINEMNEYDVLMGSMVDEIDVIGDSRMRRCRSKRTQQQVSKIVNICAAYSKETVSMLSGETIHAPLSLHSMMQREAEKLRHTAAHYKLCYLTANQAYIWHRMFVLHRNVSKWNAAEYNNPADYETYINPILLPPSCPPVLIHEKCNNFPGVYCHALRYPQITIQYRSEDKKNMEEKAEGFRALVLQHCLSHLKGKIILDETVGATRLAIQHPLDHILKNTKFLFGEYALRIKLFEKENKNHEDNQEYVKFKKDYLNRIQEVYPIEVDNIGTEIYS